MTRMQRLGELPEGVTPVTDVVVVGGGPAGLTVARELASTGILVTVLESGLDDEAESHADLNAVDGAGDILGKDQVAKRLQFHGHGSPHWSAEVQAFGVRCRGLGGSTQAWAGKSAPFDPIDYRRRDWVPNSGWPIDEDEIRPHVARAMEILNLAPGEPPATFSSSGLRSFFWQFARSRVDRMDVMRFGREYRSNPDPGITILLDATVTRLGLSEDGARFDHLDAVSSCGRTVRIRSGTCVLAASAIENARLLLASNDMHPDGIGNAHDNVGRYLMDHAGAPVGRIEGRAIAPIIREFGFRGVRHDGEARMFMHGLAIAPDVQEREGLLNAAVYFSPHRSPRDPWDALKRIIRRESARPVRDAMAIAGGAGLIAKGLGVKALEHPRMPRAFRDAIVNAAIRFNPNMVAGEFQSQGLPHRLTSITIEAITEQQPDRESRVTLSSRRDRHGVPLPRAEWRVGQAERRTLRAIAGMVGTGLASRNLPAPRLEPWAQGDGDAVIIDMAHTMGTTRMSADPRDGVVDADCRVHGVDGLHVAGGSVFPTSGHANPTLMIVALAVRLARHIAADSKPRPRIRSIRTEGRMAKVFVTGAAGRIGRALVADLLRNGHQVVGLAHANRGTDPEVEWVTGDIRNPDDYRHALAGCDAVIHLAASLSDRKSMDAVNVDATMALLREARAAGVRYFGHTSSVVVYGSPESRRVDEETPIVDPSRNMVEQYHAEPYMLDYARTKALAEIALRKETGIVIDIYRPTVVTEVHDYLAIANSGTLRKALMARRIPQFVTTPDVASAIRHLMERGLEAEVGRGVEAYNLSDSSWPTYADLVGRAWNLTGNDRFTIKYAAPAFVDRLKDAMKYRTLRTRHPLGALKISNAKLRATGFVHPIGLDTAVAVAAGKIPHP